MPGSPLTSNSPVFRASTAPPSVPLPTWGLSETSCPVLWLRKIQAPALGAGRKLTFPCTGGCTPHHRWVKHFRFSDNSGFYGEEPLGSRWPPPLWSAGSLTTLALTLSPLLFSVSSFHLTFLIPWGSFQGGFGREEAETACVQPALPHWGHCFPVHQRWTSITIFGGRGVSHSRDGSPQRTFGNARYWSSRGVWGGRLPNILPCLGHPPPQRISWAKRQQGRGRETPPTESYFLPNKSQTPQHSLPGPSLPSLHPPASPGPSPRRPLPIPGAQKFVPATGPLYLLRPQPDTLFMLVGLSSNVTSSLGLTLTHPFASLTPYSLSPSPKKLSVTFIVFFRVSSVLKLASPSPLFILIFAWYLLVVSPWEWVPGLSWCWAFCLASPLRRWTKGLVYWSSSILLVCLLKEFLRATCPFLGHVKADI